jgi:hypothetical protein
VEQHLILGNFFKQHKTSPITTQAQCQACGYTWLFGTCLNGIVPVTSCSSPAQWVSYATGANAALPPNFPLEVSDAIGNVSTINSLSQILPCSTVVCPTITVSTQSLNNVTCNGLNNGSASVKCKWWGRSLHLHLAAWQFIGCKSK